MCLQRRRRRLHKEDYYFEKEEGRSLLSSKFLRFLQVHGGGAEEWAMYYPFKWDDEKAAAILALCHPSPPN
jgi:hypothetical protein